MTNEIIGIVMALAITLILFVLRNLILPSKRAHKPRTVRIAHHDTMELNREDALKNVRPLRPADFEKIEPDRQPERSPGKDIEGQGLRPA